MPEIEITLAQFINDWAIGKTAAGGGQIKVIKFQHNVEEFITQAGEFSQKAFENNFRTGGYFGHAWKPRESAWGKRFTHPILDDTGTLKSSLKSKFAKTTGARFKGICVYNISTTEKSYAISGKRGKNNNGLDGGSYAAIHNSGTDIMPQRQFMGNSDYLNNQIESMYLPLIFKGIFE